MTRTKLNTQITRAEKIDGPRVLVVGTMLRPPSAAGYEVQVIEEVDRAQEINDAACQSDCVVLALHQPAENLQLCQQLRSQPETSELPIMIGVTKCAEATAAIQAGASEFCFTVAAQEELPARLQLCLLNHQHAQRIAWQLDEQQREITISHLLMDKVVDALPVSLYVVDRNLRIVAWNRNREIGGQGIQRQQVIGRKVWEVFSKMPRYRLEREFQQVFASGELLRFEQESTVEGNTRHWLISKIPMCLGEDNNLVTHVITVGEEITEQKKMDSAIIHAAKLAGIGRLASGVVHEINNPLATIAACTEALQNRLEEAAIFSDETRADFREYLKLVNDETFRCKTITNNLLEFSRHREAEKRPHNLNYLIEQTLRLVKHHPKLKQLQLHIEWGENLPQINANEGQIKQVFLALITNACDAVEESTGTLTIRTGLFKLNGSEFIGVDFTDNGSGIAPEMRTKIFEPFVTTKPFGQGTGLGLAVCYGIVSDHGGKVEVLSQVGQGTTMRILLPIFT
jgi:two-component system, NtrC family, sensor kinase